MIIQFNQDILDLEDKPIILKQTESDTGIPLTLKSLAVQALIGDLLDPSGQAERLTATDKVEHGILATEIFKSIVPLDLTVEQVAKLKDRIGRGFGTLVVMRAYELLDPK